MQGPRQMARQSAARRRCNAVTFGQVLVVCAVLFVLVVLCVPILCPHHRGDNRGPRCMGNLCQIARSSITYCKDYDLWLPCGGNGAGEHDESPMFPAATVDVATPAWYEAMQAYLAPGAELAKWRAETALQKGREPTRGELAGYLAELSSVLTCPCKRQAGIGYGYNYTAPYGASAVYPYEGSPWTWEDKDGRGYRYPVDAAGKRSPVPILWYGQHVRTDALSMPPGQVAFCDTGRITNDADLSTPPEEWEEDGTSNVTGYVRFPLCDSYVRSEKYRKTKAWRPVARHGHRRDKVGAAMFDGSAQMIQIGKLVGPRWGDPKCMFDNEPPHRPPARGEPVAVKKEPSP